MRRPPALWTLGFESVDTGKGGGSGGSLRDSPHLALRNGAGGLLLQTATLRRRRCKPISPIKAATRPGAPAPTIGPGTANSVQSVHAGLMTGLPNATSKKLSAPLFDG